MFKLLPKSKYPAGMLYFFIRTYFNYLCTIYKRFKRKTSYVLEKLFEKDLVNFVSDSIFKCLNFDYSSSETVSDQKKNYFLMTVYSWRSD